MLSILGTTFQVVAKCGWPHSQVSADSQEPLEAVTFTLGLPDDAHQSLGQGYEEKKYIA
ncbi:hypothetical protein Pint_16201 [Pistacia integerrima]|uniref:Uncharacterized protein n=1 Tax=Pistacia integerrima TaxID=434235 RepID=A0ACC0ZCU2_9ROSI|nr:hypothetical protein Pint_16201 [Pistacia integerrima]